MIIYARPYPKGTPFAGGPGTWVCKARLKNADMPLLCTREAGHPGRHEACGVGNASMYASWTDSETNKQGNA